MTKYRYEGAYPATVTLPDGSTVPVNPGDVVDLGKAPVGRQWVPASSPHNGAGQETAAAVLAEVDGDVEKATAALTAEQDAARPRKGLIEKLEAILADAEQHGDGTPPAATDEDSGDPASTN